MIHLLYYVKDERKGRKRCYRTIEQVRKHLPEYKEMDGVFCILIYDRHHLIEKWKYIDGEWECNAYPTKAVDVTLEISFFLLILLIAVMLFLPFACP